MVQSSSISMKTMTIAGLQSLEGEEGTLPIEVYCGAWINLNSIKTMV